MDVHKIEHLEHNIYGKMDTSYKSLADAILEKQELTPEIEQEIQQLIQETIKEI
jgi:F0F1-type ATP synthase alpha subunit